jgi:uncharacterized membrane protein
MAMQPASLVLAAQKGGGEAAFGMLALILMIAIVANIIALVVLIYYLLACKRCLERISPRLRTIEPGHVWLCFIPFFGGIWFIIMMFKITESLRREYRARRMRGDGDFGQFAAILYIIGIVVPFVGLVGFIMHWMKVAQYTRELQYGPRRKKIKRRRYDDDDDDDDDRPSRRSDPRNWDRD